MKKMRLEIPDEVRRAFIPPPDQHFLDEWLSGRMGCHHRWQQVGASGLSFLCDRCQVKITILKPKGGRYV